MKNRNNVDVDYFKKELAALSQSLENRTPDELQRYLMKLADVAKPVTFRIDYDDDPIIVLAKTEKALNAIGFNIEFKDDDLSHAKQYFLMREPASEMNKPAKEQLFKTLDLVYDVKKDKNGFSFEDVTGKHRNNVAWDYELAEYTPENYKMAIEYFAQYEAYRYFNKFIKRMKQVIKLDKEEFSCAKDEPVNWIDAQMKANEQYKSKL